MRADWNERAAEDAYYYVAFGRREQEDEEFFATAGDVIRNLTGELKRLRAREAALEIGCGPGRLMRPMSRFFGEVHGIDVSDEMIRLARERLRDVTNAYPRHGSGSDLSMYPDGRFDFVYSYAVFQHIPSRDVVMNYLREARRVLKPGGSFHLLDFVSDHASHGFLHRLVHSHAELKDNTDERILQLMSRAGFTNAEKVRAGSMFFGVLRTAYYRANNG